MMLEVFTGASDDVYRHLATEDLLLREAQQHRAFLFFWQSRCAVVIGKNQNPWREARVPLLPQEHCSLARRTSGGGAVFHDAGNLNVAFVLPIYLYRREIIFGVFQRALATLGVKTHFIGRTNLGVQGRKISGHAFAFRARAVLHHATLLIHADKAKMQRVLRGRDSAIQTHAVSSEPVDVINLSELEPCLSTPEVITAIERAAKEILSCEVQATQKWPEDFGPLLAEHAAYFASWTWIYGRTPPFKVYVHDTVQSHEFFANLHVADGIVAQGEVSLASSAHPRVSLAEIRFTQDDIFRRLRQEGWADALARKMAERLLNA